MHVMGFIESFDLLGSTMWQLGRKKLDHPNHHYVAEKEKESAETKVLFYNPAPLESPPLATEVVVAENAWHSSIRADFWQP